MEEAFLEIYSLVSLGHVNNTTVFISKLSSQYYCVTWWQSHSFFRAAGATAALWFSFIEALKNLELCFGWICYGPRCGQRLRKGLIDIGYKFMRI